jgi:hypothetical protein
LQSYGLTTTIQSFSVTGKNVLATQLGTEYPNMKYIICAHYDDMPSGTIAPGAMDNAGGTSAVIEAARILSQYSIPITIVYALWDEEEQWLVGSTYYATQAAAAGDSILGVINLDGGSYDPNNDGRVNVHNCSVGSSIRLYNKIVEVNNQYGINLNIVSRNPPRYDSDQASFWAAGYGAIFPEEDYDNEPYPFVHQVNDSVKYLSQPYYLKTTKLALATLAELALGLDILAIQSYVDKTFLRMYLDSVLFNTRFLNLYNHTFTPYLIYANTNSTEKDSLLLFDDGLHGDSLANDGVYGVNIPPRTIENFYVLSVSTFDNQTNKYFVATDYCKFTTAGPVIVDSMYSAFQPAQKRFAFILNLRNLGSTLQISNPSVEVICTDPWVIGIVGATETAPTILPGQRVSCSQVTSIYYDSLSFPGYFNLKFEIMSGGYCYWGDSLKYFVPGWNGVEGETNETLTEFSLAQNYPNPFNSTSIIKYSIPKSSQVSLKIFNTLGEEIEALVKEEKPIGTYELNWNAANLPSGVYFYQLRAGDYTSVKKMILLK